MLKIENVVRLDLGVKAENLSRAIEIDCGLWKEQYPNGNINIYHQRPGETSMDVTGATYDNETGVLRWELTQTDTFIDGFGQAEIRLVEDNVVKKTAKIVTLIHPSVVDTNGGVIESNQQAYLDAASAIFGSTQREAIDAHAFAMDAEAWAKGTRDGSAVEEQDETYHNNAKYYKEQAAGSATYATTGAMTATGMANTATQKASQAEANAAAAAQSAMSASASATSALTSSTAAGTAKTNAEAAAATATSMAQSAQQQAARAISASGSAYAYKEDAADSAAAAALHATAAGANRAAAEAARDAAQAAAGDFQGLSATASGLPAGSQPNIEVTHSEGGLYQFAFGIPKGDKGDKGDTGDPAPTAQVTAAVESWLEDNMSNPDSPPLDRSLNLSSAAAPADLVGSLKSAINTIENTAVFGTQSTEQVETLIDMSTAESGTLDSDGSVISSESLVVSDYIDISGAETVYRYGSGETEYTFYRYAVYDANHTLLYYQNNVQPSGYEYETINEHSDSLEYDIDYTGAKYIRISTNPTYDSLKYAIITSELVGYALTVPITSPNINSMSESVETLEERVEDIPENLVEGVKETVEVEELIDISEAQSGTLDSDGTVVASTSLVVTDYIDISRAKTVYRYGSGSTKYTFYRYAVYDKNHALLSYHNNVQPANYEYVTINNHTDSLEYDISDTGAKYIRISTNPTYTVLKYCIIKDKIDYLINGSVIDDNTNYYMSAAKRVFSIDNADVIKFANRSAVIFQYGDDIEEDTYYDENNTKIVSSSYISSRIVPIESGLTYVAANVARICYFDENKSFISGFQPYTTNSNVSIFTVSNNNVKYARFSCWSTLAVYVYGVMKYTAEPDVLCMGDSIFGQYPPINDIPSSAEVKTGITFNNVAVGGTIAGSRTGDYDYWSFYKLADAIYSGDFSEQESRLVDGWVHFRVDNLTNADFSKLKMITLNYGTNDWNFGCEIDNENNRLDTSTYKGALRYGVEKILSKYPNIIFLFVSPIYRKINGEGSDILVNENGVKLEAFVTAMKEVAEEYNMPFADFYHSCGINGLTVGLYTRDGTHPSYIEGIQLLGNKLGGIVETIL